MSGVIGFQAANVVETATPMESAAPPTRDASRLRNVFLLLFIIQLLPVQHSPLQLQPLQHGLPQHGGLHPSWFPP
jgi:hypothetical protein